MDKYHIPQHLDEPLKFLLWTMDEIISFALPFALLTFLYNQVLIGGAIGAALVYGLKKLKGEQGHYYLFNLIYWYLPPLTKMKVTPPSHLRELIG